MFDAKKLVLVLTTSTLVIVVGKECSKKTDVALKKIQCIYDQLHFWKDKKSDVLALIDSSNKVNAMGQAYAANLDLKTCHTDVRA